MQRHGPADGAAAPCIPGRDVVDSAPHLHSRPVARPVQRVRPVRLSRRQLVYVGLRRRVEAVLALGGLVVAAVPMGMVALGVLLTMGRPVLFSQERMTQGGRVFTLWKFRSMSHPGAKGARHDEDRLAGFGRFIRSTSLDELPSLWNIVRGDMGIVGPRPLPTYYLGRFGAEQFARHTVPAGRTGHAQVHGRNELEWDARMALDQEYIERIGLRQDLRIVLDTVRVVLQRHGAEYEGGLRASTDFPGPQSMPDLELGGPYVNGTWWCRGRDGREVLRGAVRMLDLDVALLTSLELGDVREGEGVLLAEALLLLISRLRAQEQAAWAGVDAGVELPEELLEALVGNGFVAPGDAAGFPTAETAPATMDGVVPALIAFVGRPDPDLLPSSPLLSVVRPEPYP